MSNNTIEVLDLKLNTGKSLPLRVAQSKRGNAYWGIMATKKDGTKYLNKYGVTVSSKVIGETLPTSVTICGQSFALVADKTEKDQDRLRANGTITVPGHGKKVFSFRCTVTKDGFNLSSTVHGASTGGARVVDEL